MKKGFKLCALVIAAVMLASVLVGCSLFGTNTQKYRSLNVMKVGNEDVTLGRLYDIYNNYYNNYYYYVYYGIWTLEDLFSRAMDIAYTTYMKLDAYKTAADVQTYTTAENKYADKYANAKYLTAAEMDIVLSNVKYGMFSALDSAVESYIANEVGALGEEEEDTSRDFYQFDDMKSAATYAEKVYMDNLTDEDGEEYFEKYYDAEVAVNPSYADYVYTAEAQAAAKVDYINKLLKLKYLADNEKEEADLTEEDNAKISSVSAAQYIEWQKRAVKTYTKSVKNNYGIDMDAFFADQVENYIVTAIGLKYDYKVVAGIETDANFLNDLEQTLSQNVADATAKYALQSSNFTSFIEDLKDDSIIYNVPAEYQQADDQYIFVKNLLFKFSDEQTATLKSYEKILGSSTSAEYLKEREKIAADIIGIDYNDDEAEVTGLFTYNDVTEKVELAPGTALYDALSGTVSAEDFNALMAQYNQDTAQHATYYDYVARVGNGVPESYSSSWVAEFVDAANAAYETGKGSWTVCVTTYGIHIVYYTAPVTDFVFDTFDTSKTYDTTSNEYRLLKTVYTAKATVLQNKDTEELDNKYKYGGLITKTSYFDKLLDTFGVTYDFNAAMTK